MVFAGVHDRVSDDRQATPPHVIAAEAFMELKGYEGAQPREIIRVEGQYCWYCYYDIDDEGEIELEVSWDKADGWNAVITAFHPLT